MSAVLKTRLWSEPLGWAACFLWNLTIASGPLTFSFGYSQGREYTEYLWPFDVTLVLAILLLMVNTFMTIAKRKEEGLYVSVWYYVGTLVWTAGFYPIGNVMWHPNTGALAGHHGPDRALVLRPQPAGAFAHAACRGIGLLRHPADNEDAAQFPHALARRLLDARCLLYPYRRAPYPPDADPELAQSDVRGRLDHA